jgi:energy-coupling factor transporter ATP-binding protein EcfA2
VSNTSRGARWWRFDFHAHTPASTDFGKGSNQSVESQVTPREWLLAYMRAEIDCVAVTDHNSGEWIDNLSATLDELRAEAPTGFRPITIFPGAEITSNSGCHMLTLFKPGTPKADVDGFLGAIVLQGKKGEGTAVAKSTVDVAELVQRHGGLTVLAHVDGPCGANGTGDSMGPLVEAHTIDAIEVCDPTRTLKPALRDSGLSRVLGSDCHHLDGSTGPKCPGSHFTWIKMGAPTLEGVRLALIDGDGASVLRSDAVPSGFDPNTTPADWIESIEVADAKVMGRGTPAILQFNSSLNAIVGGRGTGKSTLVHLLRAALHRVDEIKLLSDTAEPRQDLYRFLKSYGNRNESGGLTQDTQARIVYRHAAKRFRITWTGGENKVEGETRVEEESGEAWAPGQTQAVRDRFPIRIFSQGQILELTGRDSAALLEFIDDASDAGTLKKRIDDEQSRFLTLRARGRELRQKAQNLDSVRARLEDVQHKLSTLEQSQHSTVLREHQRRNRQVRELETARDDARAHAEKIRTLAHDLSLADIPHDLFDTADPVEGTALHELEKLRKAMEAASVSLQNSAGDIERAEQVFSTEAIQLAIGPAADRSRERYDALVEALRNEGVSDPNEFGILVQGRQRLETEWKTLLSAKEGAVDVTKAADAAQSAICDLRLRLWEHRQEWVETTLRGNRFVRISVEPYGTDPELVARSFREIIGVTDARFAIDIFDEEKSEGLIVDLFRGGSSDARERCQHVNDGLRKLQRDLETGGSFGGHFRNFIARERERRPELMDRLALWAPEDGVRIEYSPKGDGKDFRPISQGSAGQRSAAILAFFLAYGDEPLVLDQPEDDLDNHLIYDLIVQQLRESKKRRQVIVVTHNPNVVVNGYAELVFVMDFKAGQCVVGHSGCLQDEDIRDEVFKVMEGGRDAFMRRFRRMDGGRSV